MTDMNAFEQELSAGFKGLMGPSEPVDDAAIFTAISATRSPAWRVRPLFSATRFMVASVIVALFGGFLLAGVLTTQQGDGVAPGALTESPSPTTTETLLPGVELTAQEVEPGVYRVSDDGVRDLGSLEASAIVAGYDGGIWLVRADDFVRLGRDRSYGWPTVLGPKGRDLEVGPDETFWTIPNPSLGAEWTGDDVFRSADGVDWAVQPCPNDCVGITVAPDGRTWASWTDGERSWRVSTLDADGVGQLLDGSIPNEFSPGGFHRLAFSDSGDLYGVAFGYLPSLYRYADGAWHRTLDMFYMADVGADGTVWAIEGDRWHDSLTRLSDGQSSTWTAGELPEMAWSRGGGMGLGIGLGHPFGGDSFRVAPDGSVWALLWRNSDGVDAGVGDAALVDREERYNAVADGRATCDGVVRFDGLATDHFLAGRCVTMDIAADGSVWVLADGEAGKGLYVITPAAVTASE